MGLSASIRWCMTGTPIQNTLDDLGSLVTFLHVPIMENLKVFRKYIIGSKKYGLRDLQGDKNNLILLLNSICLRRNLSVLSLSSASTTEYRLDLSPSERKAYNSLIKGLKRAIEDAISNRPGSKTHRNILEYLLRMRIFCNNGLRTRTKSGQMLVDKDELLSLLQQSGDATCASCDSDVISLDQQDDGKSSVLTHCFRLVCSDCASHFRESISGQFRKCEFCRNTNEIGNFSLVSTSRDSSSPSTPNEDKSISETSTKIKALVGDIKKHLTGHKRCTTNSLFNVNISNPK